MTETRNENFNLSKILENYLDKEDINGALNLIQNNKFNNKLYNGGCSEEIQVLFQYLTEDVFRNKIDFYTDCENLLKEVCKLANEDDVLFELLEIIETTKNDNIFISALKGLQISILYSKSGKTRGLQWILDTVLDYIKKVEIPDYLADKCEDEEGKLIENDDRVKRLLTIYLTVFLFLEPIINAARETGQANRDVSLKFRENVLLSFLFRLLSGKFAYLEIIPSSDKIGKSYALQCGENFVNLINILLRNNPFYTLSYVTTKLENITKGRSSRNLNVYLSEDKIPMLSLAVFYYLIFEHNLLSDECPKVYSYTYIFENVLESAIYLLTMSEGCFIYKGLKLCNGLFNFYQQQTQCKIEFDKYSRGLNYNFLSALINDIIYNNNYRNRKVGIEILKKYILLFDDAGIYFNVRMILSNKAWINLHGYMAILYKNVVDLKLSSSKTELSEFYRDEKFEEILELVCSLKKGSETDLLENSDLILSGLNMVRYFAIRDKENRTKFWNIAKKVEQQFLIPLRNAINFSRAHYQAEKVRVQEEAEDKQMEEDICNVVTNYGEEVPILTKVQKLNAIESAFSTFDIIECLLARARITPLTGCLTYRKYSVLSGACTKLTTVPLSRQEFKRPFSEKDKFREQEEQKEREYNESLQQDVSKKSDEKNNSEEQAKFQDMREKILKASLELVPIYGWSRQALTKGAESLGYPGVVHGMFSNGPIELVQYFYSDSNRKLVDILKLKIQQKEEVKADGQDQSKPVIVSKKPNVPIEFVREAIKCRLLMIEPYLKTWPQAVALMSLPQNAPKSLANLLTLVDDICYYSGDRSVDFGWYVRRVGLATIYKMTELYMIQDTSPNFSRTWEFLERRIEDGVYIHNFIDTSDEATKNVQQVLGTAFETARNMLGMNFNRR